MKKNNGQFFTVSSYFVGQCLPNTNIIHSIPMESDTVVGMCVIIDHTF